ncbi:MAG: VCBS repeat-containing protein [Deltaproteobacteria bacterium]|jgi:hypothetical protein|nr:VCBS repeat-containing protein [Deltaproteobacteria bacterium]
MKLVLKKYAVLTALVLCISAFAVGAAAPGQAAEAKKTYIVLPFSVNGPADYKYLENSIPGMFSSRLFWSGNYETSANESRLPKTPPANEAEVKKAMETAGADYAIWGSLVIVGEECSLDVSVIDRNGQKWPNSRQIKVAQMIPALTALCDNISADVFKRPGAVGAVAAPSRPQTGQQPMNPDMVGSSGSQLNPSIRYSGGSSSDQTRLRSQQLDYTGRGMEVCDLDGDGLNEVVICDEYNLYVYKHENNRLRPLASTQVSLTQSIVAVRSFDFSRSGKRHIILTSYDADFMPRSRIFSFDGKNLNLEMENVRYYLSVIKDLNSGREMLIGQQGDKYVMFKKGAIYEMIRNGNELVPGDRQILPEEFNVYSFVYLPAGRAIDNEAKIVSISILEKMKVWTLGGGLLSVSAEDYAGSQVPLQRSEAMPGMGEEYGPDQIKSHYYPPIRMLPVDLNRDGDYEIISTRAITMAGLVFNRNRSFLQGEIDGLYWDGTGMASQWRTRTLQGGLVDIALADLNNDGSTELIVCINTGNPMTKRKTAIIGYTLNLDTDEFLKE